MTRQEPAPTLTDRNLVREATLLASRSRLKSRARHSWMASNRMAYCALALLELLLRAVSPQAAGGTSGRCQRGGGC